MIRVNLLPPEYRKSEGTPLPRFLAIVGGVVLCASAVGIFLYVHFGYLVKYQSLREQKEDTYYKQKVLADRSLALQREYNEYQKRRKTIEKVSSQRILLSKKLDELCDLIHNRGDRKKHFIWLTHISARLGEGKKKGRGGKGGGTVSFKGFSASEDFSRLANFREDIERSAEGGFFVDFVSIDHPAWVVKRFQDNLEPQAAGTFAHSLVLKPLDWRQDPKWNKRK
jgi:Tfp pilus assembly protein PilN